MTEFTKDDWVKLSQSVRIPSLQVIGGKAVDAASGETFESVNPATQQVIGSVPASSSEDVDRAVQAARTAFESGTWSRSSPEHRKSVLHKLADLISKNARELAVLESMDMGKPVEHALNIDIAGTAHFWHWYAEAIDKVFDEIAPTGQGDLAMIRRVPMGVVAAVVPWNFPLEMATWKCAPALAAGNSVVLKPAEQSPLTAIRMAELALEAGLPEGVLNVVTGDGPNTGMPLGQHMDVDVLAFTGSTQVGKLFMGYSAQSNMKPVWLECGGKSPILVFEDTADLDAAATLAAQGIFFNQGEICSATSRLFVEASIKDAFLDKLIEKASVYKPADPLDPATQMGAIVNTLQTDSIMRFIEDGKKNADLILGGQQLTIGQSSNFIPPTIFDNVTNDMRIGREEIFGPVLSVIPFKTEEEAVGMANQSIYGLGGSVWTSNLSRAHRVSDQLNVGTVSVNCVDAISAMTPFGGMKQSGFGRDLSLHALDKYTSLKTVWVKY
ncbi:aldehyde dehydrogenase [Leisingera daeponensis]|uniref:aldehyde dehydrogenase n=1 Tax=Leisingera daeponensis TaxID=405746 RepID=UPI001C93975E|nr:aldehyde dehydrogenase [Leisingera daeponensis]MBY6058758.1 aldehyde dehydrogenase [Leisingera daeponensis]